MSLFRSSWPLPWPPKWSYFLLFPFTSLNSHMLCCLVTSSFLSVPLQHYKFIQYNSVCVSWLFIMSDSFVTPWTVVHQVPLSMEFSRQEYWSGFHFLLQGIFLTQGLNSCLLHSRWILYCLSRQASPRCSLGATNLLTFFSMKSIYSK